MPTLNWIGREAVINHHNNVPYRLLRPDEQLSAGDPESGNLLIEGDNLEALKALLPYYGGQVKCIFIDPPYNTGNENWSYNDKVNSPQMRAWLASVVGADDLSRHDKWLCMMYPRLRLLWEFLNDQGSLWMTIDDNEVHHARAILDDIFGEQNFVANVVWQKIFAPKGSARHLSASHDHILLYSKRADVWRRNLLPRTEAQDRRYSNPDNDSRGPWASDNLCARNYYSLGTYAIVCPSGRVISGPPKGTYWRVSKDTFDDLVDDHRIWWGADGGNVPRLKRFLSEVKEGVVPQTIWFHQDVGNTQEAKKEVLAILPDAASVFITPKPTRLLRRILQIATCPGDLVLDSFAGSGTTGHTVLQANEHDDGGRRFILVELEPSIARTVTAERLRRVIQGYTRTDQRGNQKHELGLGGGFSFCTLGPTLFDEFGAIHPQVTFHDLAAHIFFAETRQPVPSAPTLDSPLIGAYHGTSYYLFFNGVRGGSCLDAAALGLIEADSGPLVAYADTCSLSSRTLSERNITFKQIPYEVTRR